MVKPKARSKFRQYIRTKPTKWVFKYWILADPTGYTCDFNVYCGRHRTAPLSEHGLSYDVVMELVRPIQFQGYSLFVNNFYTSPALVHALKEKTSWHCWVALTSLDGPGTTYIHKMMCTYVGRTTIVCAYCRTVTLATVTEPQRDRERIRWICAHGHCSTIRCQAV